MGMMQDHPLVVSELLEYAVKVHGSREIVSRTVEDPSKVHRYLSICVASLCFVLFKACHASCSSRLATLTYCFQPSARGVMECLCVMSCRYTYVDAGVRTRKLANALAGLGVGISDRVATIAWNGYRHFELYYAISGSGAVLHTINPRLAPEQLGYVINHAEDKGKWEGGREL